MGKYLVVYGTLLLGLGLLFFWIWRILGRAQRRFTIEAAQTWEVWVEVPGSKPKMIGTADSEGEGWELAQRKLREMKLDSDVAPIRVDLKPVLNQVIEGKKP